MVNGGPTVNIGTAYAKSLDAFNTDSPKANHKPPEGHINFQKIQARHGPLALYSHIMRAAFDPVYGREMTIAHEYERPATRFPLIENQRPNERSEKNAIALSGGYNLKDVNPLEHTVTIPGTNKRQERPYQLYSQYRHEDDESNPVKMGKERGAYKIFSMVRALEKRAKQYFRIFYNPHRKSDESEQAVPTYDPIVDNIEDIFSMPTLEEYRMLTEVKRRRNTGQSSPLEETVNALTN